MSKIVVNCVYFIVLLQDRVRRIINVDSARSYLTEIAVWAIELLVTANRLALGNMPLCVCCSLDFNYNEGRSELL